MNCRLPTTLFKNQNYSWTELLAINIVSIYILILAVCLIFHNKVYKNYCLSFLPPKPQCVQPGCLMEVLKCLNWSCNSFALSINLFFFKSKKDIQKQQILTFVSKYFEFFPGKWPNHSIIKIVQNFLLTNCLIVY